MIAVWDCLGMVRCSLLACRAFNAKRSRKCQQNRPSTTLPSFAACYCRFVKLRVSECFCGESLKISTTAKLNVHLCVCVFMYVWLAESVRAQPVRKATQSSVQVQGCYAINHMQECRSWRAWGIHMYIYIHTCTYTIPHAGAYKGSCRRCRWSNAFNSPLISHTQRCCCCWCC